MSSVSNFLIDRLASSGVNHVFGLPGDYVLDFYSQMCNGDKIEVINTTDEAHAGFAADAYARVHGIGAVCVTYNVGALKVVNAVACAYAERSPLIIISGSPGMEERKEDSLLHHMVGSFNSQKEIFEKITCASVVLDNPLTAGYEIDKAFEALRHNKQPIYIELPRDVAKKSIKYDVYNFGTPDSPKTNASNLEEALEEITQWLNTAKKPAILAGVEVSRYKLGKQLIKFAEKLNIPVATTLLSKSVIDETHPLFAGIYQGAASKEYTKTIVEDSDCLLMFGAMLTDVSLSFKPAKFNKKQIVSCNVKGLQVKSHTYTQIQFNDFCKALFEATLQKHDSDMSFLCMAKPEFIPQPDTPITIDRVKEKINTILKPELAIVADVGDSLFMAGDLTVHHSNQFLSPAYYLSMGSAIPGALGVQTALPNVRPVVIVGDGAFQMTVSEISTIISRGLNPIIFVLNNEGFSTERLLKDGTFNDIKIWNYHNVSELFGGGCGYKVTTEQELEEAVGSALKKKEVSVINLILDRFDNSVGMRRMTKALAQKV